MTADHERRELIGQDDAVMGALARGRLGRVVVQMTGRGLVCLALVACSDNDSASETATTDSGGSPTSYAVVGDDAWSLQEAVDPRPNDAEASAERPPMDWYSEHVRTVPASGGREEQMVRLSGHSASMTGSRAALEDVGWEFDSVTTDGWKAVGGTSPSHPASPAVVLLDNGSATFMLLSYDLTVDDLARFAGSVEAVDETTWDASDGAIR